MNLHYIVHLEKGPGRQAVSQSIGMVVEPPIK